MLLQTLDQCNPQDHPRSKSLLLFIFQVYNLKINILMLTLIDEREAFFGSFGSEAEVFAAKGC